MTTPEALGSSSLELKPPLAKLPQHPGLSDSPSSMCPSLSKCSICLCPETSVALQLQSASHPFPDHPPSSTPPQSSMSQKEGET